jgi:hypothetical protein
MWNGGSKRAGGGAARLAAGALLAIVALVLGCAGTAFAAAPALSITHPETGSSTGDQQPLFQGTSDDPSDSVLLQIHAGASSSGTLVQTATVPTPVELGPESATWEVTPASALAPGEYTAVAEQANVFNETGESSPVTFTIDTTPVVSIKTVSDPTNDPTPTLSGSASNGPGDDTAVAVTVYAGASAGGTVVASGVVSRTGSSWEYTPSAPLAEGEYTVLATQEDEVGEVGESAPMTFAVDTTAPSVSMNAVSSPTGSEPTLTGGAGVAAGDEAGVGVFIYAGSVAVGTPVVDAAAAADGTTWSYTLTAPLAEGTYTARAFQRDDAGNVGESAEVTFSVVTKGPTVSIDPVASPTTDSTPPLAGSAASGALDDSTVSVNVYEGSSTSGKLVVSGAPAVLESSWSYAPPPLKNGTYTAQATQEDHLHDLGKSTPVTFTIDAPLPEVAIVSPTGKSIQYETEPTVSGTASESTPVTVRIYAGSTTSGALEETLSATVESGAWTATALDELANGFYTVQAEEVDSAGNVGKSSPVTFAITSELTLETAAFQKPGRSGPVSGPTPSFEGEALSGSGDGQKVVVELYRDIAGTWSVEREVSVERSAARWSTGPVEALESGDYAVRVEQQNVRHEPETAGEFQFTVDATAPQITLTSPSNGSSTYSSSQAVGGAAGSEEGDIGRVTIHLYAGSSASGAPLQTIDAEAIGQTWTAAFAGVEPGTYTAIAEQEDDVGNVGYSEAVTFTVVAPPVAQSPSAPVASFTSFPADPHTGESVSLVSTSTDASSAITSFGWALGGNGMFTAGGSTVSTSFSTPGLHVVQLHVTDANGQSSTISETIPVSAPVIPLMQPFPVVRVAGSFSSSGAKIGVLTVLAPVGATVRVTCKGGGCPPKGQRVRAVAGARSKASSVLITFHRFERALRTGAVLDVWISDAGEIGKFTRLVIRRDKPPNRTDLCLNPAGTAPLTCPAS